MKWGDKSDWSQMLFLEVVKAHKLVWQHTSTDSEWNTISSPMMANWPRTLLTTVSFEDIKNTTRVGMTQAPVHATNAEKACFSQMMPHMDKGWQKGYAIIDEILTPQT